MSTQVDQEINNYDCPVDGLIPETGEQRRESYE